MTRGQTVRTVKSVRYIKKELQLQYWDFTEINTVKHTQIGEEHYTSMYCQRVVCV